MNDTITSLLLKNSNNEQEKNPVIKQKKENVTSTLDTNINMMTTSLYSSSSSSSSLSSPSSPIVSLQCLDHELKVNEDPEQKRIRLYKTELCRNWEERNSCRYGEKCKYAHGKQELRSVDRHPKYKTEWCHTFETTGTCPYGVRCTFLHSTNITSTSDTILPDNNNHLIKNHSTPNLNEKRISSPSIISDISFNNTILSKQQPLSYHSTTSSTRRSSLPYSSFFSLTNNNNNNTMSSTTPTSSSSSSTIVSDTISSMPSTHLNNHHLLLTSSSTKNNDQLYLNTPPPVSLIPQNLIEDINGPITPPSSIPPNESFPPINNYFLKDYDYSTTAFSN